MDGDYIARNLQASDALAPRPKGVALVDLGLAYSVADSCMAAVKRAEERHEPLDAYSWRLGVVSAILFLVGARPTSPDVEMDAYLRQGGAR